MDNKTIQELKKQGCSGGIVIFNENGYVDRIGVPCFPRRNNVAIKKYIKLIEEIITNKKISYLFDISKNKESLEYPEEMGMIGTILIDIKTFLVPEISENTIKLELILTDIEIESLTKTKEKLQKTTNIPS